MGEKIFVTGAGGFLGTAVTAALRRAGAELRVGSGARLAAGEAPELAGCDAVVHLAGLAHTDASEEALMRANAALTARLARAAADAGVKRFVFASSARAAADDSAAGALDESSPAAPSDAYGRSKRDAENALAEARDLSWIALRFPLVHAPGARANFASLMQLADLPLPLPLASLDNRRNTIARASAVRALIAAAAPDAPTGIFFVADQPALTPGAMITALRAGRGRLPGLFRAPWVHDLIARSRFASLVKPFEVDDTRFRTAFPAFRPAHKDSAEALEDTARGWPY